MKQVVLSGADGVGAKKNPASASYALSAITSEFHQAMERTLAGAGLLCGHFKAFPPFESEALFFLPT